jgi:hypothetical protein
MYHDVNDEISMKSRTTELMAKFGITTIPALVLLDERGQVICKDGRGWCAADPMGLALPWRGKAKGGLVARAVVNFDLPPAEQGRQPASPARILPPNRPQNENLTGKPDPVSALYSAGDLSVKVKRRTGPPIPPASAQTTPPPDGPPPSFNSSRPCFNSSRAADTGVRRWAR